MKSRKRKSTSRLTSFLLFLSLLLSVFAVFPSSVYAVGTEAEPVIEDQTAQQEEDLSLQEPIDTTIETEFENLAENTASTASVTSTPVVSNTENTSIVPAKGVDMTLGQYQNVRVRTTLSNVTNVIASVDNASILSIQAMTNFNGSDRFFKVTAKQVGIATMTATVTCSNNTTEVVTIEFYVTMSDGIYAIKSCATHLPTSMGDYYLRAEDLDESIPYVYASTNTYGDMTNNIYRYWRVEYAGNGEYKIKPLVDDTTALTALGQWVTVDDDSDSVLKRWVIRYRPGGYEIITSLGLQDGEGMVLSTSTVLNGQYSSTQYYYYAEPTLVEVQNMAFERWQFVSADIAGVYFKDDTTKRIYETLSVTRLYDDGAFDLEDLGYTLFAFGYDESTAGSPQWTSGSAAIAMVNATTGRITPQKGGTVTVTVNISGTQLSASMNVTFKMIEDGTYFLRNLQTGLYADIEDGDMTSGNEVEQQSFDGANTQKWIFTHIGDNVYTIRSTQNISYYLGISGDSTEDETPIVLRTGTVTNGMKWRVENGNQGYKIVSYSDPTMVLCTSTASATAGSNLKLSDFQSGNNSYQDEWELHIISDFTLLALNENSVERNDYFNEVQTTIESNLDGLFYTDFYTQYSLNDMKRLLCDNEIFIIHTHGYKEGFMIAPSLYLTMDNIKNLNLDSLKFALLLTCETGLDYSATHILQNKPVNIVEQMVCRGANTVIGFSEITYVSDCNLLAEDFITETIVNGKSVENAMNDIDYDEEYLTNMSTIDVIAGNGQLTLNN